MRGSWFARTAFVCAAVLALTACTMLTGVGDLVVGDAPDASELVEANAPARADTGGPTPLTVPDASPDPEAETDAETDAGVLPKVDATVVDACSPAACELLPAGFALVALGPSNVACPAGFGTPTSAIENPTFDPGACACGACSLGQQPSCRADPSASVTLLYGPGGGGACPSMGTPVSVGCATDGFQGPFIPFDRSYVAPPATLTGGTCTPNVVKTATKLKTTAVRVCSAMQIPQCEGKTCLPAVAPFSACIAASGTQMCPASWPTRHVVGSSASFTCSAGCTCAVGGTCSVAGRISYFSSANCSGAAGVVYPVDGGCNSTAGTAAAFGSHRYDPDPPSGVSCQTGGTSTPSAATLAGPLTVCCK